MSIQFKALDFGYTEKGRPVFSGFSAEFQKDRITVLTGASGCGKSSLLYLAAGIYPHNAGFLQSGTVAVDGIAPEPLPPRERCRLVGMMFQNPELQFCMDTVKNELVFCLENACTPPEAIEKTMDQALDFCGIRHLKDRTLLSLSGGERQKAMLACLTALKPKWLLLDEPFANIDNASAKAIARKLARLHQEFHIGILAVDHRLDNWLSVADEIRILENGALLPDVVRTSVLKANLKETPNTGDSSAQSSITGGSSAQSFIAEDIPETGNSNAEKILESHGIIVPGRSYRPDLSPPEAGEIVLELKNMSLFHGKTEILKDVNAVFRRGLIYAIVGESGCGKSSLFGALSGLYNYQGSILFHGKELRKTRKKQTGQMGFVTQNPQDQFVSGTIRQEILASLRKVPGAEKISEEILRGIRLWRYRDVSPYLLSQGQQRRLGVAALMAYDCRLLVCDEPTYAQDRNNTIAIMDALCEQARKRHAALVFSTHDGQLAKDYADKIFQLKGGVLHECNQSGL